MLYVYCTTPCEKSKDPNEPITSELSYNEYEDISSKKRKATLFMDDRISDGMLRQILGGNGCAPACNLEGDRRKGWGIEGYPLAMVYSPLQGFKDIYISFVTENGYIPISLSSEDLVDFGGGVVL